MSLLRLLQVSSMRKPSSSSSLLIPRCSYSALLPRRPKLSLLAPPNPLLGCHVMVRPLRPDPPRSAPDPNASECCPSSPLLLTLAVLLLLCPTGLMPQCDAKTGPLCSSSVPLCLMPQHKAKIGPPCSSSAGLASRRPRATPSGLQRYLGAPRRGPPRHPLSRMEPPAVA